MNDKNLFGQINFWRTIMIELLKESSEESLYKIPDGFSNNLIWNAGHVLVTYDEYLSKLVDEKKQLEKVYYQCFSTGTNPADWIEGPPPLQSIMQHMEEQPYVMEKLLAGRLQEKLSQPLAYEKTVEELLCFLISHECYHLGTMKSISRLTFKD